GDTTLQVETVVAICRAYHLDFIEAFVAAGFITREEAQHFGARFDLSQVSDLELSKEMLRRVAAGTAGPLITEPASEDLIDDVLRSVEDARAQEKKSDYAAAADARADRTPGEHGDDDRAGI
ncbi:hypothetical protein, partial [Kitasatospora herbaricolor]|uniref:hypothetical protein n=1 Tax=Kitasatospora herbaricolor TaxID=68217 RepID=UPI0036DBB8CC